jgi:hypothetical protein
VRARLLHRHAVIHGASNPVKDWLVERVHQWPVVNAEAAFIHRRSITPTRPRHFFRVSMPAQVTLDRLIRPQLGDAAEIGRDV